MRRVLGFWMAAALVAAGSVVVLPGGSAFADGGQPVQPAPHVGHFDTKDFSTQARSLPPALSDAVRRDLSVTPEQYLADSAAAVDAVGVVAGLARQGVTVLGSSIHGTSLTVNVSSKADAARVTAAGGHAVVGVPQPPALGGHVLHTDSTDLYDGQGYSFEDSQFLYQCSIGFNGHDKSTGASQFVTAGHCLAPTSGIDGTINSLRQGTVAGAVGGTPPPGGVPIGLPVPGAAHFASGDDYGLVAESSAGLNPLASVFTWGQGSGSFPVVGQSSGIVGASLCKSGSRTGWTCGTIDAVDYAIDVDDDGITHQLNAIIASTCMLPGDSGGAAVMGQYAVGVDSASSYVSSCSEPDQISAYFPMVSWGSSVQTALGSRWEPSVTVSKPVLTGSSADGFLAPNAPLTGTLANVSAPTALKVYLDGSSTPIAATIFGTGTANWTVNLAGVAPGHHTYSAVATWGQWSSSAPTTGSFSIVSVDRVAGDDRYAGAIAVADSAYPGTAPIVFVASGENYPDALSVAPAAAALGGPLLLTPATSLPLAVKNEIVKLAPSRIVIIGGNGSVSDAVMAQLTQLVPDTERIGGIDRYATSRAVIGELFDHATTVFLASGGDFPDALSAASAASTQSAPVVLVPAGAASLDSATIALFGDLGVTSVAIAGGNATVSPAVENQLRGMYSSVIRLGGIDRYATSSAINSHYFSSPSHVYVATGANFPDALAGSVLAAKNGSPLLVTPATCLLGYDRDSLAAWGTSQVTLLGGTGVMTPAVEKLTKC